jgi:hypothetical protein
MRRFAPSRQHIQAFYIKRTTEPSGTGITVLSSNHSGSGPQLVAGRLARNGEAARAFKVGAARPRGGRRDCMKMHCQHLAVGAHRRA